MKTVIMNGSPRKNWNTAQLLQEAKKGAEAAGAEVTYVNLYDLNYKGCHSCLACKRKGIPNPCHCYWKDELSPVLDTILQADHLIIGTPIFFGEPTGEFRAFMERLIFPTFSYNDYSGLFKGKIDVDIFLTMNAEPKDYKELYEKKLQEYFAPFHFLNGRVQIIPVCDTLQVKDYSKYDMAGFSEEHKRKVHDQEFPQQLKTAFQLGAGKV